MLQPELIDSVESLEWIARYLGSGYVLGKHYSRKLGSGLEFDQFRPYAQGDDLRALDWKMYAKTGKYFIRMSNVEVDNTLSIHIDNSLSMNYQENGNSKLQLAKILTATLSYIMVQQADRFAWESGHTCIAPARGKQHWRKSLNPLFHLKPDLTLESFQLLSPGIHLWITDLYLDMNVIKEMLSSLHESKREVVLFHLIGRKEEQLQFNANTKFIDLETNEALQVNVSTYAGEYKKKLNEHFAQVQRYCANQGIVMQKIYLDAPLADVLRSFVTHYNFIKST